MAPVVQIPTQQNSKTEKPKKPTERRPELICRVKHCNTLPDIPFDPKFIVYPFDTKRFVEYKQTSLEKNYKHDLLTEQDLGVTIDLINPETYDVPEKSPRLEEKDEKLLEDEALAPQDTKRSRCHNRAITWLKKTEYISTEFNRYGASSDKTETKVGFGVKKKISDESFYLDRNSQILAINKTFESAKKAIISHPTKRGLKPVKVWPVFPDFKLWKYPFAQVTFDADPAPIEKEEEMSQAMVRGVMDASGEQFVAYCLPTEDTMYKRKIDKLENRDYTENEEYEFKVTREYNWNVNNKATKGYEENYFFVWRDEAICYNTLETKVKLTKRRVKNNTTNSKLIVRHRPLSEQELNLYKLRMQQLEPLQDEDEMYKQEKTNENGKNVDDENDNQHDGSENEKDDDNENDNKNRVDEDGSEKEEENEYEEKMDTKERKSDDERSEKSPESSMSDSESDSDNVISPKYVQNTNKPISKNRPNDESKSEKSSSDSSSSESEKNASSSLSSDSDSDDDAHKRTRQIFGSDSDS